MVASWNSFSVIGKNALHQTLEMIQYFILKFLNQDINENRIFSIDGRYWKDFMVADFLKWFYQLPSCRLYRYLALEYGKPFLRTLGHFQRYSLTQQMLIIVRYSSIGARVTGIFVTRL